MKAWYFSKKDCLLLYGDKRKIEVGITHTVEGKPECCYHGLHGSVRPLDALNYAPGPMIWQVEIEGEIDKNHDKICGSSRTYIRGFDATEVLRRFATKCALDVIHLWNAPDIVIQYLKTGDESIRDAAGAAAWAAGAAAWAARAAAWAARDAGAARAAGAARDAARAAGAARDAAKEKQNRRLAAMIAAEFKRLEK